MPTKSMDWFNSSGPNKTSSNSHESGISMAQGGNMLPNGKQNFNVKEMSYNLITLVFVLPLIEV